MFGVRLPEEGWEYEEEADYYHEEHSDDDGDDCAESFNDVDEVATENESSEASQDPYRVSENDEDAEDDSSGERMADSNMAYLSSERRHQIPSVYDSVIQAHYRHPSFNSSQTYLALYAMEHPSEVDMEAHGHEFSHEDELNLAEEIHHQVSLLNRQVRSLQARREGSSDCPHPALPY